MGPQSASPAVVHPVGLCDDGRRLVRGLGLVVAYVVFQEVSLDGFVRFAWNQAGLNWCHRPCALESGVMDALEQSVQVLLLTKRERLVNPCFFSVCLSPRLFCTPYAS